MKTNINVIKTNLLNFLFKIMLTYSMNMGNIVKKVMGKYLGKQIYKDIKKFLG